MPWDVSVPQDGEHAMGRRESAQHRGDALDVTEALVDKITRQDDDVAILRLRQVHGLAEVGGRDVTAAMEVGKLDDAQAGKPGGEVPDRYFVTIQLQPRRFHADGVVDPCPAPPDPARPPPPPFEAGFRPQPAD